MVVIGKKRKRLTLAGSSDRLRLNASDDVILLNAEDSLGDTDQTSRVTYSGDGTTTEFNIPFPFRYDDEIVVQIFQGIPS